jgi:hypothetical protein
MARVFSRLIWAGRLYYGDPFFSANLLETGARASGSSVLREENTCGTANGTLVDIAGCTAATHQQWSKQ